MASNWEQLEKDCFNYLKAKYPSLKSVEAYGKSDSTKPDIKLTNSNDEEFFIEVKSENAQCCQFVAFPNEDSEEFDFSSQNQAPFSNGCRAILDYMKNDFSKFKSVNSAGIDIEVDKSVLYSLVQDFYAPKGVKFFITKADDFIVFPIEKFEDYFDISACYRKKKSGSNEVNKNQEDELTAGLMSIDSDAVFEFAFVGGKQRCICFSNKIKHAQRLICKDYTYQFKDNEYSSQCERAGVNAFEVRRLSNTNNPNIICTLKLKNCVQDIEDLNSFEQSI